MVSTPASTIADRLENVHLENETFPEGRAIDPTETAEKDQCLASDFAPWAHGPCCIPGHVDAGRGFRSHGHRGRHNERHGAKSRDFRGEGLPLGRSFALETPCYMAPPFHRRNHPHGHRNPHQGLHPPDGCPMPPSPPGQHNFRHMHSSHLPDPSSPPLLPEGLHRTKPHHCPPAHCMHSDTGPEPRLPPHFFASFDGMGPLGSAPPHHPFHHFECPELLDIPIHAGPHHVGHLGHPGRHHGRRGGRPDPKGHGGQGGRHRSPHHYAHHAHYMTPGSVH